MRRFSLLLSLLLIAACGGTSAAPSSTTTSTLAPTTTTTIHYPADIEAPPDPRPVFQGLATESLESGATLVAMVSGDVDVYESADADEPFTVVPATTILGTVTVLTVVDGPRDGWAEVMLPVRPNESTGWVETDDMELYVVEGRVVIDLSKKWLTYYENEEMVLETSVAIGSERNPTPTGSFFITDNVTLANPNSPWGPHALGTSARSDTITEYNGGDGIIGIHGTNRPSSIGKAASLGCVRLPNDVIVQLHEMIPIGTPVDIIA